MEQSKSQLIEEILDHFQRISNLERFEPKVWLDLNLTIVQLKTLFFIDSRGSTHFKNLADALGVTPPSVTGIIDRLVEQDLVSRKENPENRRTQILKVTPKGKDLLANLKEIHRGKMTSILVQLSLRDLTELARIIKNLVELEHPQENSDERHITN